MVLLFCTVLADGEGKTEIQSSPISKDIAASNKIVAVAPTSVAGTIVGPVVSSGMTTVLELRNPSSVHSKANATSAPQPSVLPAEAWLQVCSAYIIILAVQITYSTFIYMYMCMTCNNNAVSSSFADTKVILVGMMCLCRMSAS